MSNQHDHGHTENAEHGPADHPRTAAEWDERYNSAERLWTAEANPALMREAAGLKPGRALDVGSGEGADARWLADRGWEVVAVDISQVALDRAAAIDPREAISWRQVDLMTEPVPGGPFDLVTASYFHVDADRGDVFAKLADALSPGGTLLVVVHDPEGMRAHGVNPDDYLQPKDIAEQLADRFDVEVLGIVARGRPAGGTAAQQHMDDSILKARRR
ncbi:MAG: class I SAM-dependent methyltransferase [Gordonia sp. (in: high G+C Gram-positive bacteria)]